MPIQRPLMSIQRTAPQVATAAQLWGCQHWALLYSQTQSFNLSVPACRQPPMPADEPLWPLGGPHHVGLLSFGTWSGIPVGRWAGGSCSSPPLVLQHGGAPQTCASGSSGRTGCPWITFSPPSRPGRQLAR